MPENWHNPWKPVAAAKLAADEEIAMLSRFAIKSKEHEFTAHTIFMVVRKGDKAIGRTVIVHSNDQGYNNGTAHDLVTYPINKVEALVDEMKNYTIAMGQKVVEEDGDLQLDMSEPGIFMFPPLGTTKQMIATKMEKEMPEELEQAAEVIIKVLGLKQKIEIKTTPNMIMTMEVQEEAAKKAVEDKRIAEEALIKKFGKKKMEELARTINYKGALINK
jgi:hypothetical protein